MAEARGKPIRSIAGACLLAAMLLGSAGAAEAQRRAARQPFYGVEIEPQLVWQWTGDEWSSEDGVGLGVRASIPVIEDGPLTSLRNNLAVTFGLAWAHFDDECRAGGGWSDCDEDDFWLPIAAQWNFFLTDVISLFPELGLGFRSAVWSNDACDFDEDDDVCDDSDLEVHLVLWLGARFKVSDTIALTMRLGTPSLTFGVSFFL
jgi:hypothetical protein